MGKLMNRKDYLSNIHAINEEAPFGNDIPWGDSLIGRLINSISRNAKISFNKRKIDSLSKRMKSIFDEMLEFGNISITDDDKNFLQASSILGELKKSVYDKEDISIIISLTEKLIDIVNKLKFNKKDIMLKALNEFLDFLNSEHSDADDTDDSNSDADDADLDVKKDDINYNRLLLQSVVDLHNDIRQNVVRIKSNKDNVGTFFDEEKYKKQRANTKEEISKKIEMIESAIKTYQVKKDKERQNFYWNERIKYENKLKALNKPVTNPDRPVTVAKPADRTADNDIEDDDLDFKLKKQEVEKEMRESFINEGEANLHNNEIHSKNAWIKLVNAYNKSGVSKYISFIETLLATSISSGKDSLKESNDKINKICEQIVLNFGSIGKPLEFKELIAESTESVNLSDVSKSISLFGRVIMSFSDDIGLLDTYGSSNKHAKSFINSFKNIRKGSQNHEEKKVELKKESVLSYLMFVEGIKHNNDEIKSKFDELFTEEITSYFNITEEKKSELESNIKTRKEFIFTSSDPIIEIVRLFNRAWRLHTPGAIPSGRTAGKVSNSVFREYEYLGDGSGGTPDAPGSGPYRNIKLYEAWGESVQDILSDTKYRPLFSENTVFKFKNEETDGEGDNIKKGGKILLRFVSRLLADTVMYSNKGAMSKFIKEYFKLGSDDLDKIGGVSYREFPNDERKNNKVVSSLKRENVQFIKLDRHISEEDIDENVLFKSNFLTSESKPGEDFFKIHSVDEDKYVYFIYSLNGIPYDTTSAIFKSSKPKSSPSSVWVCKARHRDFLDIPVSKKIEFSYIEVLKSNSVKQIKKINTSSFSVLVETGTEDYYKGLKKMGTSFIKKISEDVINKAIQKLR